MAGAKRNRKRTGREARIAAAEAARRRAARRRLLLIVVPVVVVIVAIVVVVVVNRGGSSKAKPAAKPCVPMSEPPPNGAPTVAVKAGPPPTQLVKEDLKVGDGAPVMKDASVTVNYIGVLCTTGKVFDSSYSRNQPASFPLTNVIPGWKQGIPDMRVGGQRLLGVPAELAYGPQGHPPEIGPDEPLWFVVEVLDSKPA